MATTHISGPLIVTNRYYREVRASDSRVLAVVHEPRSGVISSIDVYGDSTNKPDEGDADVDGTMQWALDLLTTQNTGGQINQRSGDDFNYATPLSATTGLKGISIIGHVGKNSYYNQPASGTNLTYLWDFGVLGTSTDDFRIENCVFYGRGDSGNTSGGVRWNDMTSSYFSKNYMLLFDGTAVDWKSDGGATSALNWMLNNTITQCNGQAFELTGTGGNVDHRISGNYFNAISGFTSGEYVVQFNARGGGTRFTDNHIHNSFGNGFSSSGQGLILSGNYFDSMLATYLQIAGDAWTVSTSRFFNNGDPGASANGIIVTGDGSTLSALTFIEPNSSNRINDCVRISGDDNTTDGLTVKAPNGIAGATAHILAAADGNEIGKINGDVKTCTIDATAVNNLVSGIGVTTTNNSDTTNKYIDAAEIIAIP